MIHGGEKKMDNNKDFDINMSCEELEKLKIEKSKNVQICKKNVKEILFSKFHSPLFIVYASSLSLISLISIILIFATRNVFCSPWLLRQLSLQSACGDYI